MAPLSLLVHRTSIFFRQHSTRAKPIPVVATLDIRVPGSGLQFKFGQSTVSRQDMSGSIPANESEEFLKTVTKLAEEVSPSGELLIHDTGMDIEILPRLSQESQAESATFHKGKVPWGGGGHAVGGGVRVDRRGG